jgi:hypothetical protein
MCLYGHSPSLTGAGISSYVASVAGTGSSDVLTNSWPPLNISGGGRPSAPHSAERMAPSAGPPRSHAWALAGCVTSAEGYLSGTRLALP